MKEFVFDDIKISNKCITYKTLKDLNIKISSTIFDEILFSKGNYKKLIKYLKNNKISEFRIFNNFDIILRISKIDFLESAILYIKLNQNENNKIYNELLNIKEQLNYEKYINQNEVHIINIDNKEYKIPVSYYFKFLNANNYEELIKQEDYYNIPMPKFIYALVNYFEFNKLFSKFTFPNSLRNRYLELIKYKKVDFEYINKILITKDKYQKRVKISQDVYNILNKKYSDDKLENIIKVYIELCKFFTYDYKFYLDSNDDEAKKHLSVSYLPYVNKDNTNIVCYEFPEIFGYFLKQNNINYSIIGGNKYYALEHNYLIFRYDKYLIKIEPIKTVYKSDFSNVKTNLPLVGIECLNQNENTKNEFLKILKSCYLPEKIDIQNDILPFNKIDNFQSSSLEFKDCLIKIDIIFKKLKEKNLEPIEKLDYFKELMKYFFHELKTQNKIDYFFLSNYTNIVYIIAYNDINLERDDNLYLMYYKDNLSFITKEELSELFNRKQFLKIGKKEIPGLNLEKKSRK